MLTYSRNFCSLLRKGACGGEVGLGTGLLAGISQVRFLMGSRGYFIDIILPAALWPSGLDLPHRNGYQGYLLGLKAVGA